MAELASRNAMNTFLSELEKKRRNSNSLSRATEGPEYAWATIGKKINEGTRNAAKEVFCSIYRGALPLKEDHKLSYKTSLDKCVEDYISKASDGGDIYDYLYEAGQKGSKAAKELCDKAHKEVEAACMPFYEAAADPEQGLDADSIDVSPTSEIVGSVVDKLSNDMSAEQISEVIENNVKDTIAHEVAVAKEEDEKVAELQSQLTADDTMMTEEAIDVAIMEAGFDPKHIYQPGLFTGIMTGKVSNMRKENPPKNEAEASSLQKQAFYDSVKELTVLKTMQAFDILNLNATNASKLASRYAIGG